VSSYTVYKHTSPRGKVYIGITARPVSRRWRGGSAYRNNAHFYAAIKKYGWEAFQHAILAEGLTKEAACAMEVRLIAEHDSTNPAKGYNRSRGGDKTTMGYRVSNTTRQKISQALVGKKKGVPHTRAHAEHISRGLMGHRVTEATREKLRAVLGDRFNTAEARARQKVNTPRGETHHRATSVSCIDTGEIYPTIQEAAKAKGLHRSGVSACCRGAQQSAGGLRWQYYKEKGQAAAIEALRLEVTKK
jgi:group I intron endonuclease